MARQNPWVGELGIVVHDWLIGYVANLLSERIYQELLFCAQRDTLPPPTRTLPCQRNHRGIESYWVSARVSFSIAPSERGWSVIVISHRDRNRPNQEILIPDWLITSHVTLITSSDWFLHRDRGVSSSRIAGSMIPAVSICNWTLRDSKYTQL